MATEIGIDFLKADSASPSTPEGRQKAVDFCYAIQLFHAGQDECAESPIKFEEGCNERAQKILDECALLGVVPSPEGTDRAIRQILLIVIEQSDNLREIVGMLPHDLRGKLLRDHPELVGMLDTPYAK